MRTWQDYANDPFSRKIYLAEVEAARLADGAVQTQTLGFATEGLVDDDDVFWEPRLRGVPRFSRSAREVWRGLTQIGYGSLELINSDGGLDELLTGWSLTGRRVRVRLGFAGLPTDQYRYVFTGRLGVPTLTDASVSFAITDELTLLLRTRPTAGVRQGQLPDLVASILDAAGITEREPDRWTAWASEYAFPAWISLSGTDDAATALDSLLAGLPVWWGMSRTGAFQIGGVDLPGPEETPALTFADDLEILDFSSAEQDWLCWKTGLQYYTDTQSSPVVRASVQLSDASLTSLYPLARESTDATTALTDAADAATVLNRRWDLFRSPRRIVSVTAKVQPLGLELGDVISLSRARYGIGGLFRLVGLDEDHTGNKVKMELLG